MTFQPKILGTHPCMLKRNVETSKKAHGFWSFLWRGHSFDKRLNNLPTKLVYITYFIDISKKINLSVSIVAAIQKNSYNTYSHYGRTVIALPQSSILCWCKLVCKKIDE